MTAGVAIVVVAAFAIGAAVQLVAGFGFSIAVLPVLSWVLDTKDAVVAATVLAIAVSGYQAITGRDDIVRPVAKRMLAGSYAGMPVGLLAFLLASDRALRVGVGLASLVAVVVLVRGLDLRHAGPSLDIGAGLVAGVLSTSVSVNGPPLVAALQARHLSADQFRSTNCAVLAGAGVVAAVLFVVSGSVTADAGAAMAVGTPGMVAGGLAGLAVRRNLDQVWFRHLVIVLLGIGAVTMLLDAVSG